MWNMNKYGGVGALISALYGRKWPASHDDCFNRREGAQGTHCTGELVGPWAGQDALFNEKTLSLSSWKHRSQIVKPTPRLLKRTFVFRLPTEICNSYLLMHTTRTAHRVLIDLNGKYPQEWQMLSTFARLEILKWLWRNSTGTTHRVVWHTLSALRGIPLPSS